nr:hypothetical protein [Tanacetum cinerariifolium]
MDDRKQQYLDELKCLSNLEYRDEIKIAELKENFNGMSIEIRKKEKLLQQEQWAYLSTHPSKRLHSFCYDDDDEDYTSAITPDEPVLSTEEPDNSLNQIEDLSESNKEFSSIDNDSFSSDNIDYVEASPLDSERISSEVMEIVIPEVGGTDDDILLTIKDDILREKLLNVNLLIAKIEALNANPTPSSDCKTKSSSTSLNSLLEETNTFDNSLLDFETFCFDEFPDIDSFNDIHPHFDDNPLSGSTTYSSNSLLEEFTDELALITYPPDYNENLQFDIEFDLKEIEFLLYQGKDSGLKDSIDQTDLANLDDYFVDTTPEMFTDEHAPDYSSPLRFDVYDDDFLEDESDADNVYDDPFDSKGEKIKESTLFIDELDLPCDFLPYPEYDSFNSQDFSRDDDLPSPDNEDKKKLAISYASLVFEDFDPPFYEPLVFKDVPNSMMLLLFSSENEEKVFKPGIYTSEKVHSCFLPELSHPGYHIFKVNQIFISLMRIFHVQSGKNTPLLDVLLFHFYPP